VLTLFTLLMLAQAPARTVDACALLAAEDVSRILDVPIRSARPVTEAARGVLLHQCYISTGSPRSISIAVAGPMKTGNRTLTPRQFWREQFHPSGRVRSSGTKEETSARRVRGVGEEAFWSGTRVSGALYVLTGNTFIRISVGGIQHERELIEKSRQLAAAALARLQTR
jgi:hypothetical protein